MDFFNPMKSYEGASPEIFDFLSRLLASSHRQVCFYNDNSGYYFSPFRHGNVCLSLRDEKYYNLFCVLKNDGALAKVVFKKLLQAMHYSLIDHLEGRVFTEDNVVVSSWSLLVLMNLSNNIDGGLSNYDENNMERLFKSVESLDSYYLPNEIYLDEIPKNSFVVSVDSPFENREGIILTRKSMPHELIRKFENLNIYYVESDDDRKN